MGKGFETKPYSKWRRDSRWLFGNYYAYPKGKDVNKLQSKFIKKSKFKSEDKK